MADPPPDPLPIDPDRVVALESVPVAARRAMAALFALDERLGGIVARTREPTIGLMRLVWWRDALAALGSGPPPAEPLLVALAASGLPGDRLAAMTAGWEALLYDPDIGAEAVATHGASRGGGLFALAGTLLDAGAADAARLGRVGAGWALTDLARHLDRPALREAIRGQARGLLDDETRWPRRLRPLGQLAALARADMAAAAPLTPRRRVLRAMRMQLTGR